MADEIIPVVDFGAMGLNCQNPPAHDEESVKMLADKIHTAFSTIGFVYLTNHGISDAEISEVRKAGDGFFNLPTHVKTQFTRPSDGKNFGWVSLERESLNPSRPGDLKECFNVQFNELQNESTRWPDQEVPDFKPVVTSFFDKCKDLAFRILKVVGIGLKLQDPKFLTQVHRHIGMAENPSVLRLLYYPPLPEESNIKPGQVRCGEHSDYGTITLLFQDDVGGLEVLPLNKEYMPARPIAGTVLVNIGDLMMRWTADKLISTKHRVLIPEEELKKRIVRQSIAFFVNPDSEAVIECLDGSNKYPPITSMGYLQQRFDATY
ncbi:hypothetical protein ACROYT_G034503 [Oculina patagonica]